MTRTLLPRGRIGSALPAGTPCAVVGHLVQGDPAHDPETDRHIPIATLNASVSGLECVDDMSKFFDFAR